jgi:hypothetical protein
MVPPGEKVVADDHYALVLCNDGSGAGVSLCGFKTASL